MEGYTSKYDKAIKIAKSYGFKETDYRFNNVVKQIFAKLIVGRDTTISRDLITGKLTLHKRQ